jgi:hypothetical protein
MACHGDCRFLFFTTYQHCKRPLKLLAYIRRVANATFYTEGFSSFLASAAASIATECNEPVPGWVYPRCGPAPFHDALR